MTSDANGWPDADKGHGHHWAKLSDMWMLIVGVEGVWRDTLGWKLPERIRASASYHGPVTTPSEAQQREHAAAAAAWLAAREAAVQAVQMSIAVSVDRLQPGLERAHERIRALPPPEDAVAALAEVVKKATREAFEEAAKIAQIGKADARCPRWCDCEGGCIAKDPYDEIAAAIRARAEGGAA